MNKNKRPDKPGVWEWFDEHGMKHLVQVCNVSCSERLYLRVYFWGGYYNVNDEVYDLFNCKGELVKKGFVEKSEWADKWGEYVGEIGSVRDEDLYLQPTAQQYKKIMETHGKSMC